MMQQLYDTDMGEQLLDVSASTRKFQKSIIITQDPTREGVLAALAKVEESRPSPPTEQAPQTMRPRRRQGGY